jgi:tol-pal system protein YbgF
VRFPKPPSRLALMGAVVALGLSLPTMANAFDGAVTASPVLPVLKADAPARVLVAQNQQAAQIAVQLQEMQEQIRLLTGQVEGLQFQLTQMQTLIERMQEDNEFRFQQLEGGAAPGKPPAATELGGAMPAEGLPQDPAQIEPFAAGDPPTAGEIPLLTDDQPMEHGFDLGESADPMVGGNAAPGEAGTLGTLDGTTPLDLTFDSGAQVSSGDANAQYQAGYDAITRGDYAFAEEQFRQFIDLYPDDPQAADATNWLGEALIQRGAFDDAALVLAEGYQKHANTPRAADLMLKLGIALYGAGEGEVACRTFFTLERRFTDLQPAFRQRLAEEKSKAQCPV